MVTIEGGSAKTEPSKSHTHLISSQPPLRHFGSRENGNRGGGFRGGDKRKQQWQRKGNQPTLSQQLASPCPFHVYKDEQGNIKPSHPLAECQRFKELQALFARTQQSATIVGFSQLPRSLPYTNEGVNALLPSPVPGALAIGAPPPRPASFAGAVPVALAPPSEVPTTVANSYPTPVGHICMIQKGKPTNRVQKSITRQVHMAVRSASLFNGVARLV